MSSINSKRLFLIDCNNFFVSCERVFNPKLRNRPVVVLSSNDGCIIARSNEAKALNIPMGAPAYQFQDVFKKHNVIQYSSNFSLYADMSARVMQTVAEEATDIEVYSVDEAFLYMADYEKNSAYYSAQAQRLIRKVKQNTGIPISVGIGPTKTLAKIANRMAKKNPSYNGHFDITDQPDVDLILEKISVADIWGIGRQYSRFLISHNITNAKEFKYASDAWIRKNLTIMGLRTAHELRGIACYDLVEQVDPKKSITVSRSFGKPITDIELLKQATAGYTITAIEKLREEKRISAHITVFVIVNKYHDSNRCYESVTIKLPSASFYTPDFITAAKKAIDKIYKPNHIYRKAGVILTELIPQEFMQLNWYAPSTIDAEKQSTTMETIDSTNEKWGKDRITYAAAGVQKEWKTKSEKKSAHFTTSWHEILTIDV